MEIKVVNLYRHTPTDADYYCGRGSVFGNPYTHRPSKYSNVIHVDTRDQACDMYKELLKKQLPISKELQAGFYQLYQILRTHGHLNLVCYCAPQRCHAEEVRKVLIKLIERYEDAS